jgi:hypothetical protein
MVFQIGGVGIEIVTGVAVKRLAKRFEVLHEAEMVLVEVQIHFLRILDVGFPYY